MADPIPEGTRPLPTCDDSDDHVLDHAWGRTYCICNHNIVVNFVNHAHRSGPELDLDETTVPLWWLDRLTGERDALDAGGLTLDHAWSSLCLTARGIATGPSWEIWDDFRLYWLRMSGPDAERFLGVLAAAGVATVETRPWSHADHAGAWHDGTACGCTEINLTLHTAEPKVLGGSA